MATGWQLLIRRAYVAWLSVWLWTLSGAPAMATGSFVMTCQFEQQTPIYRELSALYREVFSELGLQLVLVPTTNRRAITDVARGFADGNCLRTAELINRGPYANLLQVPVVIAEFEFDAFIKVRDGKLPSLAEVIAEGGLVGFERGAWIVDEKLHKMIAHQQIVAITGTENAMAMLAADRVQAFVHNRDKVLHALAHMDGDVPAIESAGTLVAAKMILVVHQRHLRLLAPLQRQLQETLLQRCQRTDQWPILCNFYRRQMPPVQAPMPTTPF